MWSLQMIESMHMHTKTALFNLILYVFQCHSLYRRTLIPIPKLQSSLSSTAVSWQHGADLNVLAIQLLASLHLSLRCGRVECKDWSDEDTLETIRMTKTARKII